ncbi:MAG: hypothetical protein KDJ55_14200 [Rhodobiaceae bacterium]|nr:hypothetical protein [Rhodobiaceae bacterium]MCC0018888.1 hypothetical protein [Rhodobiaceae bacterium]MCC0051221.1 hypothetical protein [Rhodobiaceae bacterium]MCC0059930.1 hypothetical protein [Rhodobiaceae bacterium]
MPDTDIKRRILEIIGKHALAAQASSYDRHVAVTAVARARAVVESMPIDPDDACDPASGILEALRALHATYNDPDGEYTNGKGVLGSLIDDVTHDLSSGEP